MQLPNLVHPKKVLINGAFFEVATYEPVTDQEATKIAVLFVRDQRKKFKKGLTYRVMFNNSGGTFLP